MVPPWVPDPLPPPGPDDNDGDAPLPDQTGAPPPPQPAPAPRSPAPLAPPGRFGPARTSLGRYAQSGSQGDMRRGLGHYVSKGLGGSSTATRRLAGTARTAGSLYGALSSVAAGRAAEPGSPLDPALLSGRSTDEVMNAIIEATRPVDGTLDGEADRNAIHNALSELLARAPDADFLNLTIDDRLFIIERFVAADIFNRIELDIGKHIQDKAPSISAGLARLRDMKDYIRQAISSTFRKLRSSGGQPTARRIAAIVRQTIQETFEVFEAYVQ